MRNEGLDPSMIIISGCKYAFQRNYAIHRLPVYRKREPGGLPFCLSTSLSFRMNMRNLSFVFVYMV